MGELIKQRRYFVDLSSRCCTATQRQWRRYRCQQPASTTQCRSLLTFNPFSGPRLTCINFAVVFFLLPWSRMLELRGFCSTLLGSYRTHYQFHRVSRNYDAGQSAINLASTNNAWRDFPHKRHVYSYFSCSLALFCARRSPCLFLPFYSLGYCTARDRGCKLSYRGTILTNVSRVWFVGLD